MRHPRTLFIVLLVFLPAAPAFAWSPEGHQVAAAIALRELNPVARAQVSLLLDGEAVMVLDSSWADEVRDQRPETQPWHYVNIEIGSQGYDAGHDCRGGNCVVAQIEKDRRILSDPRAPRPVKAEALRFLIHFVADLHQPLHVADRGDKGGNDVLVRWRGKRTNLHHIWDQEVVAAQGRDSTRLAADIDTHLTPQQKAQMRAGTPQDWANESFTLAEREIYAKLPPGTRIRLPDNYAQAESRVARLQLAKAGLRLAAVLNGIWH